MQEIKDTQRAKVRIGYDGQVHKTYRGPMARERFENETRVLRYLKEKGCEYVPQLLESDEEELKIVTSNCGARADSVTDAKATMLYAELEKAFGVKHDDPFARNITYSARLGRFCIIDFEFAVINETGEGLTIKEAEAYAEKCRNQQAKELP